MSREQDALRKAAEKAAELLKKAGKSGVITQSPQPPREETQSSERIVRSTSSR